MRSLPWSDSQNRKARELTVSAHTRSRKILETPRATDVHLRRRMRALSTLAALAISAATQACLLTPNQGDVLCGANQSVTFSGYSNAPNQTVYLQAAPSRSGPFVTVATTVTSATPLNYASTNIYSFSKSAVITQWSSNDATLKTYVRAMIYPTGSPQSPAYLNTFDKQPPAGNNAAHCINTRVNAGDTLSQAVDYCNSNDSPIAELSAPAVTTCPCNPMTYTGDLTIATANEAANYKCLTSLTGNLTVTESAPETVGFPSLTSISGNATLHYERPTTIPNEPFHTRVIDLPALTSIGGNVALTGRTSESVSGTPGGLHAVTSVGGDIRITVYGTNPNVFAGLQHLDGDLLIEGWNGAASNLDIGGSATLANLHTVGGNVHVRGFYACNNMLNGIQAIDGNLTVEAVRLYPSVSFNAVQTVGGNLHFIAMKQFGPPWSSLQTVGGELGVFNHATTTNLSILPVSNFDAGGLRVENNATLTGLGVNVQLGAGDIHIHNNPALSQCTVNNFVSAQTAGGFTGDVYATNTVACP